MGNTEDDPILLVVWASAPGLYGRLNKRKRLTIELTDWEKNRREGSSIASIKSA